MKNKIPTAEEFYKLKYPDLSPEECMIEFTKLHIDACKEEIANNAKTKSDWYQSNDCPDGFSYEAIDRDSILNAYPKTNIK